MLHLRLTGVSTKVCVLVPLALTLIAFTLPACSIYTNSDRDNFNAKAVPQQAVSATCTLQTEDDVTPAITLRCGTPPNDKTIVRVSR